MLEQKNWGCWEQGNGWAGSITSMHASMLPRAERKATVSGNARSQKMMFKCVHSVRHFGIGVLWEFNVVNFRMAQEYFQVMYIMSGHVCQHKLLPNKPLPTNKSLALRSRQPWRWCWCISASCFGRDGDHMEVVGAPHPRYIPNSFRGWVRSIALSLFIAIVTGSILL